MRPLISVVMPLFNASDTITFALASLQAQTCDDWECILVNDGSTDNSESVIRAVPDSRFQYHRLEHNRGRGYARQLGLTAARGKYITFLDADDWIYPDKFSTQVELLESQQDIAVVSTGMAISNAQDELVGVRRPDAVDPVVYLFCKHVGMPPVAFAPSMIAADLAKATGFDPSFPIAEDVDFLLRALLGKRCAVLSSPLYVYREHGSATPDKVNSALNYCCLMFEKQFIEHPVESSIEIAKARGKQLLYHSAAISGLWDHMIQRRSRIPKADESRQYEDAFRVISRIASLATVSA